MRCEKSTCSMRARMLLNRRLRVCLTAKYWVRIANRLFPTPSLEFAVEPSGGAAWFHCLSLNRSQTFGTAVAGLKVCDRCRLDLVECGFQIGPRILQVFDSNGQPNQRIINSERSPLLGRNRLVRH